nr:phosphotransferase [Deinococcus aestuarii]
MLSGGVNDSYLVHTAQGPLVYRLYRPGWRTAAEVAWEVALLGHLARRGADASVTVPDREGAHHHQVRAPEGPRPGALFTFAAGEAPGWKEPGNGRRFGESVAALHDALDTFADPGGRFALDLGHLIDAPLAAVRPLLANRPEDAAFLSDLGARTRERLADLAPRGLTVGVCHGDLHGGNVHVAGGVWTHFDFDCGGPGWRAYDLAVFWWSLSLGKQDADVWEAFLEGYGRNRLSDADREALPWFVVARTIWLLGLHAGLRPRLGSAFLSGAGYWREFLDFLRGWEGERLGPPGVLPLS